MIYTRQPQSAIRLLQPAKWDFAWVASLAGVPLVGPGISSMTAGIKANAVGVATSNGYSIVSAGTIPAMHSTSWTEVGCVLLDGVTSVHSLSARNTGQTVVFETGSVNLVMWGVADARLTATMPTGIVRYVARRSGNNHAVWLNGKLFGTVSPSNTPSANNGTLYAIGAQAGSGASLGLGPLTTTTGMLMVARTGSVFSDAYCQQLSANPWQLYQHPQRARKFFSVAAGGDVSVALTGAAMTASAGTLSPSTAKALLGESSAAAAGDVNQSRTVALAGQSMTISQGDLDVESGALRHFKRRQWIVRRKNELFIFDNPFDAQAFEDQNKAALAKPIGKGPRRPPKLVKSAETVSLPAVVDAAPDWAKAKLEKMIAEAQYARLLDMVAELEEEDELELILLNL